MDAIRALVERRFPGATKLSCWRFGEDETPPDATVKGSGYGRFGGKAGIAEFTDLRWITVQDGPIHYPI